MPGARGWGRRPSGIARINPGSPQAADLRVWFAVGSSDAITVHPSGWRKDITGDVQGPILTATPQEGLALTTTSTTQYVNLGANDAFTNATEHTVVLHYRKTDTTNRASTAFGVNRVESAYRIGAHLPYSDGVVYWDFGSTRLTASGLVFGDDVWAFTGGPRGMEIWQNGILRASSGTVPSRTPDSTSFRMFYGNGVTNSDLAACSDFRIYSTQRPAAVCHELTDPRTRWDLYWVPSRRVYGFVSGGAAFKSAWARNTNTVLQPGLIR